MRNILYLFIAIFVTETIKAQVGINTVVPDGSSTLDIYATNKGVSFPKINLLSVNDITTVATPKESLLIYNTNAALSGGKGYYFWNGTKWDFIFNDANASNLQNVTKYYSAVNNTTYTFSSPANFYGAANHALNEAITANPTWTEITDLTKTITIDRADNEIIFTITGMIQASNTTNNGSILSTIGIFIDDKLVDIKPFDLRLATKCSFRSFKVYGYTKNVPTGNHVVKFAIRNRSSSQATTISFGGKNNAAACNNILSDDESKISGVILINQPFNF